MDTAEIATAILNGVGTLVPLAVKLIGANQETAAQIIADMHAQVTSMSELLKDGGTMDTAFAAQDATLDMAIAKAEESK